MTRTIVAKFGGTSLASAAQLQKVQQIVEADPARRIIVPSAPGKRSKGEPKVTDLLYLCHEMATLHADFSSPLSAVRARFLDIRSALGLSTDLDTELETFEELLERGCSRDLAASRGEFLTGLLLTDLLGASFVDPVECIRIDNAGNVDPISYELLAARLRDTTGRVVMPGFYGADRNGQVKTFSRGGSDISGAVAARAARADVYENWTDVPGLLMADPRIVENPKPIREVTYRELRELSYMGAGVFHDEAMLPVSEVNIPIWIKNTAEPLEPGTQIVARLSPATEKNTEIAGIAGKKGFCLFQLHKTLMNKEIGFAHRLLGVFQRRGISVEHCPTSIDGINVLLEATELGEQEDAVIEEIQRVLRPDSITLERDLALIAVVGEGMARTVGIAAKVFGALARAGVNVRIINQGASELNIIVGVAPADFEPAVKALYAAFV